MNRYLISIVSLLLFCVGACAAERPNVVLIIGDDISPDFSCYGGQVKTPHIDQLAAGGLLFENAYVTASSCSPSRCSLITGRYPHNTGAPELHMPLPEGQFMFPQALKEAGYYSVLSGKWHMGEATRPAFDLVDDIHYPDEPTGAANWVRHLKERPKDQPFFMWFAAFDAHRPWEADTEEIPHDPNEVVVPAGVPNTEIARADVASYYDEVRRFDRFVGDVVEELKSQGAFENTLIIVMADNGRPFPRSKTSLFDGGMKTPFVIHWPKGAFETGARTRSLVSTIDIAPAVLEAAGLTIPSSLQGLSFLPICRDPEHRTRDVLFGERNWHTQIGCGRMLRWGDFVYMRDFTPAKYSFQMVNAKKATYAELLRLKEAGELLPEEAEAFSVERAKELLFDVSKDPNQVRNLAVNPEMKETLERMRAMLESWQKRTGDSIPAIEDMTPDRHDRFSYERLYPGMRPPEGIVAGQEAGATEIDDAGPIWMKDSPQ